MGLMPADSKDTNVEATVLLKQEFLEPEFLVSVPVTHFSAKATNVPSSCYDDDTNGGWFSKSAEFAPRW